MILPDASGWLWSFLFVVLAWICVDLRLMRRKLPKPTKEDHIILKGEAVIGHRHGAHPDIEKALNDPDLAVQYPDGRIVKGKGIRISLRK